jgi:hypothetical protein
VEKTRYLGILDTGKLTSFAEGEAGKVAFNPKIGKKKIGKEKKSGRKN